MWNIIICDDDISALEAITIQLKNSSDDLINSIQTFSSISKLLFFLEDNLKETFIIFMNIEFKGDSESDGITGGNQIFKLQPCSPIVFISAHKDYCEKVYDVDHSSFLVKPVTKERLRWALIKAGEKINNDLEINYNILSRGNLLRIDKQSIWALENNNRKVCLLTDYGLEWSPKKIEIIVDELKDYFVQCHKSYAVNLRKVKTMETSLFRLKNGIEIPISRNYHKESKKQFIRFMMEN